MKRLNVPGKNVEYVGRGKDVLEEIYESVAAETLKRVRKEKATKLRRKTLKMIALTEKLHREVYH